MKDNFSFKDYELNSNIMENELDDYTIIINNLNLKFSKEDLRRIFKDCGEIKKIILIKKEKYHSKAKITFESKDSLLLVLKNNF